MSNGQEHNEDISNPAEETPDGYVDTAEMGVQCHLVIKDQDTGITVVNQRG